MIETKKAFYAAVGAPLVGLKRTGDALKELSDKLTERFGDVSEKLTDDARKEFDLWADEGEKLIGKISEQKVVEDLSARVDLDEIQERVGKLRDQLEDILTSWRESFSPSETIEKPVIQVEKKPAAKKPAAKTAAARKAAAKTAPARKPAAKKAPASKPAANKPAAKATAAKKPVANKPAAKATAAK